MRAPSAFMAVRVLSMEHGIQVCSCIIHQNTDTAKTSVKIRRYGPYLLVGGMKLKLGMKSLFKCMELLLRSHGVQTIGVEQLSQRNGVGLVRRVG
mmetsp:Transcript_6005/g.10383  ORF Transcript_6005/g.10383 Transcript_6005/m.10383 type:complete len:95 (-) Transcript_6005:300-584(-)